MNGNTLNLNNWDAYTEHDYAIFNPLHTWVEYINRLIGALSGLPILIFTIMSIWLWKDKKRYLLLSIFTVLGMAFQAWLGKTQHKQHESGMAMSARTEDAVALLAGRHHVAAAVAMPGVGAAGNVRPGARDRRRYRARR